LYDRDKCWGKAKPYQVHEKNGFEAASVPRLRRQDVHEGVVSTLNFWIDLLQGRHRHPKHQSTREWFPPPVGIPKVSKENLFGTLDYAIRKSKNTIDRLGQELQAAQGLEEAAGAYLRITFEEGVIKASQAVRNRAVKLWRSRKS